MQIERGAERFVGGVMFARGAHDILFDPSDARKMLPISKLRRIEDKTHDAKKENGPPISVIFDIAAGEP